MTDKETSCIVIWIKKMRIRKESVILLIVVIDDNDNDDGNIDDDDDNDNIIIGRIGDGVGTSGSGDLDGSGSHG